MFFKRVHITAAQLQQGVTIKATKAALEAEAEAAGFDLGPGDIHFGKWWSVNRGWPFANVRAAKAAHTKFDKRECDGDPTFQIFVGITCELDDNSGRCVDWWAQIEKAA